MAMIRGTKGPDKLKGTTVHQLLTDYGSSKGGDSFLDLSLKGDDRPVIVFKGVKDVTDLEGSIILS